MASDVLVQVDGKASAKGLVLLQATFPVHGEVGHIQLQYSRDGQDFQEAGIGLPRPWQYFSATSSNEETTTVLVPAVAHFRLGRFRFDEPGTHYLRWSVGIKDVKGFTFEQVLQVDPPLAADLGFLAGLGDPDLMRAMYGEDFFERQTGNAVEQYADPEQRALKVIGRLLYATREKWVGDIMREAGPKGNVAAAADALATLARNIPDSSYSPYAAYYAGCCYSATCITEAIEATRARRREGGFPEELEEGKYRAALINRNDALAKAYEAFTLAARRADAYLKPRVLYQHGNLRLIAFDFDESESLLAKAAEAAPGEGTVQGWIGEARKGIEVLKPRLHGAAKETGEQRNP